MNFNKQKCITAVILLLVAILSITVIGKYASAPENHQKTIASLDEKKHEPIKGEQIRMQN